MEKHTFTEPNQKKQGRGGARPGAGRPLGSKKSGRTLAQEAVDRSLEVSARYCRELGKNTDELLHDVAYAQEWAANATIQTRMKAIGMIHDRQAPKITEGGLADTKGNPPAEIPARNSGSAVH